VDPKANSLKTVKSVTFNIRRDVKIVRGKAGEEVEFGIGCPILRFRTW
jgi:hypothetical protein